MRLAVTWWVPINVVKYPVVCTTWIPPSHDAAFRVLVEYAVVYGKASWRAQMMSRIRGVSSEYREQRLLRSSDRRHLRFLKRQEELRLRPDVGRRYLRLIDMVARLWKLCSAGTPGLDPESLLKVFQPVSSFPGGHVFRPPYTPQIEHVKQRLVALHISKMESRAKKIMDSLLDGQSIPDKLAELSRGREGEQVLFGRYYLYDSKHRHQCLQRWQRDFETLANFKKSEK